MKLKIQDCQKLIDMALAEDLGSGDITSAAIFSGDERSQAIIVAKESGIMCGGNILRFVYRQLDPGVRVSITAKDGAAVKSGDTVAAITGKTKSILIGERTALNFLQRLSGIATRAHQMMHLAGDGVIILDTRKTLPGHRMLDKYAVATGGATNHRIGLFDMVLIKDNHIKAAGSITEAVRRVRAAYGERYRVEVEAATLTEVAEAAENNVDIIMLDNMNNATMKRAVALIDGRAKIEVSGNVDERRLKSLAGLGIDYVSIGALTHSVRAFDFSMRFV